MTNQENDTDGNNTACGEIAAQERVKLINEREQLILLLVNMGFKQVSSGTESDTEDCVFLLKDSINGKEKVGVRISLPPDNDNMQMTLFGSEEENAKLVQAIGTGDYFIAVKDNQEGKVIGDYYKVTMIKEPEATSTKIKYMSLGTSNRILALLKRIIFGDKTAGLKVH